MDSARTTGAPPPVPGSPAERDLLDRFVAAFTTLDVDAIIALMTDDAWVRMPPLPFEYRGTESLRRFFAALRPVHSGYTRMVPVGANRQPAWGGYQPDPVTGGLRLSSIHVVTLAGDRVSELIRFETSLAPYFCLPRTLE